MKKLFSLIIVLLLFFIGCNKTSGGQSYTFTNNNLIDISDTTNIRNNYLGKLLSDPFFIFFFQNYPTLVIDNSENTIVQKIIYDNFDKKSINQGDTEGLYNYDIYSFINGYFFGIYNASSNDNINLLFRRKSLEIIRNIDNVVTEINHYSTDENNILLQNTYTNLDNIIITNNTIATGTAVDVIIKKNNIFWLFNYIDTYNETPDKPDIVIEINGNDIIITTYTFRPREIYSKFYFSNGILMKREYPIGDDASVETYTVNNGIGEIIETRIKDGIEVERRYLERRVNNEGFLEYEAVRYPTGRGYEIFITKDRFK